jgi:ribulose kinase
MIALSCVAIGFQTTCSLMPCDRQEDTAPQVF